MNILNLYAGLGGNRKNWPDDCVVTAVENDPEVANVYASLYPNDTLVVGDAHQFLLDNFKDYDFIWSSPPCQTHSSFRQNICVRFRGTPPVYPDMKLWQEITFLQANCDKKWVVENVKPYYPPYIQPTVILERHLFWSNFTIEEKVFEKVKIRKAQISELQKYHDISLDGVKISEKRQKLRNCVHYKIGEYIYSQAKVPIVERVEKGTIQ